LYQVDEHLGGKTHLAGIKQIQHTMEIVSVGTNRLSNTLAWAYEFSA